MALTRLGRLIVVGTILAILVGLMTYSVEPMTQYSIDEVMDSVDQHENERIHIRGIIVNGTLNLESGTVMLTGSNSTMDVIISGLSIPTGFGEGMMVSVKGTLHLTDTGHVLRADDIKTGCPSKYESSVNE